MDEKILNRVRGLLAKAESTRDQFPAEAEVLEGKAFQLMGTYGIEQAVLSARGERSDEITSVIIVVEGGYAVRFAALVDSIAKALGAELIYSPPARSRKGFVTVVGYESTLERVEFLYTLLLAQAIRGMGAVDGRTAGRTRGLRVAYLAGFADEVGERLTAAERRAQQEYGGGDRVDVGTALILADRQALVRRRYREMFPDVLTSNRKSRINTDAYDRGRRDGSTADLGGARFDGGRSRAIERS